MRDTRPIPFHYPDGGPGKGWMTVTLPALRERKDEAHRSLAEALYGFILALDQIEAYHGGIATRGIASWPEE